jgi:hypothetical protein
MGRFCFGQVCLVSWRLLVPEWAKLSQDVGYFLLLFKFVCRLLFKFVCRLTESIMYFGFGFLFIHMCIHCLGHFSVTILLNILYIPLACTIYPSSITMILRFGLLIELMSSCIFLSQLLSCLTKISSVFFFHFYFIFKI